MRNVRERQSMPKLPETASKYLIVYYEAFVAKAVTPRDVVYT